MQLEAEVEVQPVEIARGMAFEQLLVGIAPGLVHQPSAPHRRTLRNLARPAGNVGVFVDLQEGARLIVDRACNKRGEPREIGHIGNGIFVARQKAALRQPLVGDVENPLGLHCIAVDRIFVFLGRIGI